MPEHGQYTHTFSAANSHDDHLTQMSENKVAAYEDAVVQNAKLPSVQDPCAYITSVDEMSPAWDAGFEPGYGITHIDGHIIHDIIDWRWYSADDEIDVTFKTPHGEVGSVVLDRDPGQGWGFHFASIIFDGVYQCKNACTFCFMRQLPQNSRKSLRIRDDDFRLSFLEGTYVTFTNLDDAQVQRIIDEHITPLRFSLHASDPSLRRKIIGRHASRGIEVAETLLAHGIKLHVQIVLMPEVNDGDELTKTLSWCWHHPGIVSVGIVPVGYTSFQHRFHESFQNPVHAQEVIHDVVPFQKKARMQRHCTWVYLADEFYVNAYQESLIKHLPSHDSYDDFPLFEDGIGMLRTTYDEWNASAPMQHNLANTLSKTSVDIYMICGEALEYFWPKLLSSSPLQPYIHPLLVKNHHFGGNVTVTGLLCAEDIIPVARKVLDNAFCEDGHHCCIVIPDVVFNASSMTLDGCSKVEIEGALHHNVCVTSCEVQKMLQQIDMFIKGRF